MDDFNQTSFKPGAFLSATLENPDSLIGFDLDLPKNTAMLAPGVISFEPNSPADISLVISAGVHGNETAPVEMLDQLVTQLLGNELELKVRFLAILGNPLAIKNNCRFVDYDLNRLFLTPDEFNPATFARESQRAVVIQEAVSKFYTAAPELRNIHFDLHTTIRNSRVKLFTTSPLLENGDKLTPLQTNFIKSSGARTLIMQDKIGSFFSNYTSSTHNAESITFELGSVAPLGTNNMELLNKTRASIHSVLSNDLEYLAKSEQEKIDIYSIHNEVIRKSDQFYLHLNNDVMNFTQLEKGYHLSTDFDGPYFIEEDNIEIVFPNPNVALGQRAGVLIQKTPKQL